MRWTGARSRALASNYGPANQGSGPPERARDGAGRPDEEHGALQHPVGGADAVRPRLRFLAVSQFACQRPSRHGVERRIRTDPLRRGPILRSHGTKV